MINQMQFKGCIENNVDPLKLGRCQIRILGIHTFELDKVPTDDLPWANPAFPITGAQNSGVGTWSIPVKGSWVWIFFEDGEEKQRPVYWAVISGVPQEVANTSVGFSDPTSEYPLSDRVPEPDVNRLAANRDVDKTIIPIKIEEIIKSIKVASLIIRGTDLGSFTAPTDLGQKYTEPQEHYSAKYPYNRVMETEPKDYISGHIIEFDDTPGKERIHIYHKSGTWISIHSNGQSLKKVVGDNYEFVMKNNYKFVSDSDFETVWKDKRIIIKNNKQTEVYGHNRSYIKGNDVQYVSGDVAIWIGAELVTDPSDPEWKLKSKKKDGSGSSQVTPSSPAVSQKTGNLNLLVEGGIHRKTKLNEHVTVQGSYYCEVTGTRTSSKNLVGSKGYMTLEPHGEFLVKAHKMARVHGNCMFIDSGIVTGLHICPFIMFPHSFKSMSAKASI
jgi:hypothetical protein